MASEVSEIVVFIASPSDLPEERIIARHAAENVNSTLGDKCGIRIRVIGWEDTLPEVGRPQELINPQVDMCDIFIGLMHRRWGSPTGTHSSGFYEEFERAMDRRSRGSKPAVGMFFKQVPDESMSDPGPELSKVLAFRDRLTTEKSILYGTFRDAEHLELQLTKYFMGHVSGQVFEPLYSHVDGSPRGIPSSGSKEEVDKSEIINDQARMQLHEVLVNFDNFVAKGEDEDLDSDRLLLFAMSIKSDVGYLPVHVLNRLYRRRTSLVLSVAEYLAWLGSFLADLATWSATPKSRAVPGWYFLKPRTADKISLVYEALVNQILDEDLTCAKGGLIVLRELKARPVQLWENVIPESTPDVSLDSSVSVLNNDLSVEESAIGRWLKILNSDQLRDAAIEYLIAVILPDEVAVVDSLREVVSEATEEELCVVREWMLGKVDRIVEDAEKRYSLPDWRRIILWDAMEGLSNGDVLKVARGRHSSNELRGKALKELVLREAWTKELFEIAFSKGDDSVQSELLTKLGDTPPSELVEALAGVLADSNSRNSDINAIRPRLLAMVSSEKELRAMFAEGVAGVEAWEALMWLLGAKMADEAREMFDTNASTIIDKLNALPNASEWKSLHLFLRGSFRGAAISLISRLPAEDFTANDLERIRGEVGKKNDYTIVQACRALMAVATVDDVPMLIASAKNIHVYKIRDQLLGKAISLGGRNVALQLAFGGNAEEAVVGAKALKDFDVPVSKLEDLLYSAFDEVRVIALDCLKDRVDGDRLKELLDVYPMVRNSYYYNVVAELDRLVFFLTLEAD